MFCTTSKEKKQRCTWDTRECRPPRQSPTNCWDHPFLARLLQQIYLTVFIGSLKSCKHLQNKWKKFGLSARPVVVQVVQGCLLSVKVLLWSHQQKAHIHMARVPALWFTISSLRSEESSPFSVAESSFRMALGRKAGWKRQFQNIWLGHCAFCTLVKWVPPKM